MIIALVSSFAARPSMMGSSCIDSAIQRLNDAMGEEHTVSAVDEFLELADERIAEAQEKAASLDAASLGHLLHPILHGASDLGADELAWVCRRMTQLSDSGDTLTAVALLPMLHSRFREAKATLLAALAR